MALDYSERLLRISAVFPLLNRIELICGHTRKTYYFRFFAHQSVQSQLKIGDFFLVKGSRFQVVKKNKTKVPGLSGSFDNQQQLALFTPSKEL